jgi:hypothetical protein
MGRATRAVLRQRRLRIERLEERALLSGLSYTLTTDHSVYQVGQPINITLTETNTGNQPIETYWGPYIVGEFAVSDNGATIWESNPLPSPTSWTPHGP